MNWISKLRSELGHRRYLAGWLAGFAIPASAILVAGLVFLYRLPLPLALFQSVPSSLELLDRDGHPLRVTRSPSGQFHGVLSEQQLPATLVAATLAAEDARFHSHSGFDTRAILRAAWQAIKNRRIVSGASTITQQLIKLSHPIPRPSRRNWFRKAFETAQAWQLERVWSKEQILAAYLNQLDYGNLNRGAAAAAWHYFQKSPEDLSLAEATFLAGIPQSPSRLNPRRNFPSTKARQEWILDRLESLGWISPMECAQARRETLLLAPPVRAFLAPHFSDWVLQQELPARQGALRTTLDLQLNSFCEQTLGHHLAHLRGKNVRNGAVVVLDNATGDVLALVGSEDYFHPGSGQVNGATAPRSAGSTLKPFTYRLAFALGATPASLAADVPTEYATTTGLFRPQNYGRRFRGPVLYRDALANSLNVPAVRVLDSIGGPAVLQSDLKERGFTTLTRSPSEYGLGLTLGNAEVTLLELANGYASLARLGDWKPIRLWTDPVPQTKPPSPSTQSQHQRLASWWIADVLSDNRARSREFGADSPLHLNFPVACKTGTSTDYRDNWAVGYTPEFTVAVWVGNFDGSPMEKVSGVTGAAPILRDIWEHLHLDRGTSWYERPHNLVSVAIHPLTGKLISAAEPSVQHTPYPEVLEWLPPDSLPPVQALKEMDSQGRIAIGPEFKAWLEDEGRHHQKECFISTSIASVSNSLRVFSPLEGVRYFVDPDLPAESQRLQLQASLPCDWSCDTLQCIRIGGIDVAELQPGRHRLIARHSTTGTTVERWIEVSRY